MAVVIIALAVSALLGVLVTAITTSGEHRSLTVDDTILRSFAQAAMYTIEQENQGTSPAGAGSYTACASSYLVVTAPSPNSGPVLTKVIAFGSGFTSNSALAVTVGSLAATVVSGGTTDGNGNAAVVFQIPAASPTGNQTIKLADAGGHSAYSASTFNVTSGSATGFNPQEAGYTVGITGITFWNGSNSFLASGAAGSPCPSASDDNLQQITIAASSKGGVSQSLQFVVRNPSG